MIAIFPRMRSPNIKAATTRSLRHGVLRVVETHWCPNGTEGGAMQAIIRAALTVAFVVAVSSIAFSANVAVTDADTLVLDGVIYRLQGIVAPQTDQICLRTDGSVWSCGIEARDRVREFSGTGAVKCEAIGFDTKYRNRRIGRCTVDADLAEWDYGEYEGRRT